MKEEFLKNAPAFLDVLDLFTDWKRIESQMAVVFSAGDSEPRKALLLAIENLNVSRRTTEDRSKHKSGDEAFAARLSEILDMYKFDDLTRSRLGDLFGKAKVASSKVASLKVHQYDLQSLKDRKPMR